VKVWEGGLGIPGGIIGGALAGVIYAKVKKMPLGELADTVAPAIPLAQAIGRLGNWFNQELFGGPTKLPWGLEIDIAHRPDRYLATQTFHPTFLYEALWNLGLVVVLLLIDRKRVLRPGSLFFVYVGGYFTGRLWVEAMRIDEASLIWGVRVNIWMSIVAMTLSLLVVVIRGRRRPEDDGVVEDAADDGAADDEAGGGEAGDGEEADGEEADGDDDAELAPDSVARTTESGASWGDSTGPD
jgi:prolipoprotein diacylglyceryl transferase